MTTRKQNPYLPPLSVLLSQTKFPSSLQSADSTSMTTRRQNPNLPSPCVLLPHTHCTKFPSSLHSADSTTSDVLAMQVEDVYNNMDVDGRSQVTKEVLHHCYCVVPRTRRLIALLFFLKKNLSKKVVVYFSTQSSLQYHSKLLQYIKVDCFLVHGEQIYEKRVSIVSDFMEAKQGILLCTNAAFRGLDFIDVDWLVLYEPVVPKIYFLQVNRTICGGGRPMLFLTPEESEYLCYLKRREVPLKEWRFDMFDAKRLVDVQSLEKAVAKNINLKKSAKRAYKSYLLAYGSRCMVFNVDKLDLKAVAASFFLFSPPRDRLKLLRKIDQRRLRGISLTCPPRDGLMKMGRVDGSLLRGISESLSGISLTSPPRDGLKKMCKVDRSLLCGINESLSGISLSSPPRDGHKIDGRLHEIDESLRRIYL